MTTIINYNASQLLEYILSLFPKINANQFLRNQIKMIIYLYISDTPESSTDPLFYENFVFKKNLVKYARFFEYQYNYFQFSINENRDYLTISVDVEPLPVQDQISSFNIIAPILHKEKKEKRKRPIILSHHKSDYMYYNNNRDFIKQFMKPYTGFTSIVSIKIFDMMIKVDKYEQERERHIKQAKQINLAETLFHISVIQGNILKNSISSNPTKESVETKEKLLNELIGYVNTYTNELYRCTNVFRQVNACLEDKTVANYKWQKKYCQRTVLLNVDKIISRLNKDVIEYIKSFVEPCFLENIRRNCISERHFPYPRQRINDILNNLTVQQLKLLCVNNLWLMYDLNEFKNDTSLNLITDSVLFMNYYSHHNPHLMFDTNILTIYKKKKIIREIMEIITNNGLVQYYEFQRELFIINKHILINRRRI